MFANCSDGEMRGGQDFTCGGHGTFTHGNSFDLAAIGFIACQWMVVGNSGNS